MQHSADAAMDDTAFLEFLIEKALIDQTVARRAESASKQAGASIENTMMELGLVNEDALYQAMADFLGWKFATAEEFDADLVRSLGLPLEYLTRVEILPIDQTENGMILALSNPRNKDAIDSLSYHLDSDIVPVIATPSAIKNALRDTTPEHHTNPSETSTSDIERLTALANDGPIIKLVNDLIAQAADQAASDIHIEAAEAEARVRFRIDGILVPHGSLSVASFAAVTSRLKVMAKLNISEKRRPQDGRTHVSVRGRTIDIRLSTLPTQHGESVVLRLLDRSRVSLDWQKLQFDTAQASRIMQIVNQPNGVFLVAGPTGSGKTTTLYTALDGMNSSDRKVITVEDPIEYALNGINQVQVETEIDMSFSRALRSILRQDPDVIMVGEIRDEETAEIAIRAALVGRMVLSTIHTNDALSAVIRLRDLGTPPYLLAATLRGVLSQRLIRKICQDCAGTGCSQCNNTGQRGRMVLSELLEITPNLAAAISQNCDLDALHEIARSEGFMSMAENAEVLVANGFATKAEALRVAGS